MTAQPEPSIDQSWGTTGKASTTMRAIAREEMRMESQNRLKILGTSLKKLENSTSFFVATQVMLYENKWASAAPDKCKLSPPKKKLGREGGNIGEVVDVVRMTVELTRRTGPI